MKNNNQVLVATAGLSFLLSVGILIFGLTGGFDSSADKLASLESDLAQQESSLESAEDRIEELADQEAFYVDDQVNKDGYQAVFIDSADSQVYFGKLRDGEPGQVELTDVYYLSGGSYGRDGQVTGNNLSLVKLGEELHGPEDIIYITRENVLLWENMKESSQVVQAIRSYKADN